MFYLSLIVRLVGLAALASLASGCAIGNDPSLNAFVDPAKFDLYDCQQLATQRATTFARVSELQGLMAKAEQGAAGSLVSGLAYQSDYVSASGSLALIDKKRADNRCDAADFNLDNPKPKRVQR